MWRSDYASAKVRVQDINLKQLKLKVNDTYKNIEKKTIIFEPHNDEDVINKDNLDTKISKIEGQISYLEKIYNNFKMQSDKQSEHAFLIETAVKTTIYKIYDLGLFTPYIIGSAHGVLQKYLLIER